jgi:hypothetical protein
MRLCSPSLKGEKFILWGVHPIVRGNQKIHFPECIMGDVVLEIKNLTWRFGAFTAVDALPLSVNAGRSSKSSNVKNNLDCQNPEFSNFLSRTS